MADSFEEAGAALAVIGSGRPWHAKAFIEDHEVPASLRLLVDPDLKAYGAAGLHRGVARTFSALAVGSAVRALAKGHMQGATKGDALQQGGTLVIAPPAELLHLHSDERAGDHGDLAEALTAAAGRVVQPAQAG